MAFDPSQFGATVAKPTTSGGFDPGKFGATMAVKPIESYLSTKLPVQNPLKGNTSTPAVDPTAGNPIGEIASFLFPSTKSILEDVRTPGTSGKTITQRIGQGVGVGIEVATLPFVEFKAAQAGLNAWRAARAVKTGVEVAKDVAPVVKSGALKTAVKEGAKQTAIGGTYGGALAAQDESATPASIAGGAILGGAVGGVLGGTIGAITGRLGSKAAAAENALNEADNAAKNTLSAPFRSQYDEEAAAAFARQGVEAPVSAVTTSKVVQSAEATAQAGLFGSKISKTIEDARQSLFNITESLRRDLSTGNIVKRGYSDEQTGNSIKKALTDARDTFNEEKNKLYNDASSKIGNQQAVMTETRTALEDIIKQKSASLDPTARNQTRFYQQILYGTRKAEKRTYEAIKQTRTDIGSKLRNRTDPIATGDTANLKRLYAALSSDLDTTIQQSGSEAAAAFKAANDHFKAGMQSINSQVGRTILRSKSPEKLMEKLIEKGGVSNARELRALVGEEVWQEIGQTFLNGIIHDATNPARGKIIASTLTKLMRKYGDDMIQEVLGPEKFGQLKQFQRMSVAEDIFERAVKDGRIQPSALARAIDSYDASILKEVFSPEELVKLNDLRTMSSALARGTKMADGSPTAEKVIAASRGWLGATGVLGIFTGNPGLAIPAITQAIGEYGTSKLLLTSAGRKYLTTGLGKGGKIGTGEAKGVEQAQEAVPVSKSSPEAGKAANQGGQEGVVDVPVDSKIPTTIDNLYHATDAKNLESIAKNGITSGNKATFEGVSGAKNISLSGSEKQAAYYVPKNRVLLRTKSEFDPTLEHDTLGGAGNFITKDTVPSNMLEIKTKDGWKSLTDFYNKSIEKKPEGIYRYSEKPVGGETTKLRVVTKDGESKFVVEHRDKKGKIISSQTFSTRAEAMTEM